MARAEEINPPIVSRPAFGDPLKHFSVGSHWMYEDVDHRLDAQNFAGGSVQALDALERAGYQTELLGDLCGTIWHPVQNQARSNFKRIYTEPEYGVPFVSSRSMFGFPLRPERHLSTRMKKLSDLMVTRGWLVISRSGTVGNVLYMNDSLAACAISDHAIRIEPTKINSGYLYAYLSTALGQILISRRTFGATVDEIEPKHLAEIPVPRIGAALEKEIGQAVIDAYAIRDQANARLNAVETELYSLLRIDPFRVEDVEYLGGSQEPRAFEVSAAVLNDRLDATHYVPIVRSAIHKLENGAFELVRLSGRVEKIYVAPRFARVYVEPDYGIPLLQGSQMPLMRPYNLKFISTSMTDRIERWLLKSGWVLVTCSGTIGRVAVSTRAQDGWAASQHILRIMPNRKQYHPGFLWAFLATAYGQHQLKAKIYGGVVDELTEIDTGNILVPDVPVRQQEKIGRAVLAAYEQRDKALAIEESAIQKLEALLLQ